MLTALPQIIEKLVHKILLERMYCLIWLKWIYIIDHSYSCTLILAFMLTCYLLNIGKTLSQINTAYNTNKSFWSKCFTPLKSFENKERSLFGEWEPAEKWSNVVESSITFCFGKTTSSWLQVIYKYVSFSLPDGEFTTFIIHTSTKQTVNTTTQSMIPRENIIQVMTEHGT